MNFWPFHKPREPARYIVATKRESLRDAVKRVNTTRALREYVDTTTPEERAIDEAAFLAVAGSAPFKARSGHIYPPAQRRGV